MVTIDLAESEENEEGLVCLKGVPFTGATEHWRNGKLLERVEFLNGIEHGLEREWDESGHLSLEETSCLGLPNGYRRLWYSPGQLKGEELYEHGMWIYRKYWDEQGSLLREDKHAFSEQEIELLRGLRARAQSQGFGPHPLGVDPSLLPS